MWENMTPIIYIYISEHKCSVRKNGTCNIYVICIHVKQMIRTSTWKRNYLYVEEYIHVHTPVFRLCCTIHWYRLLLHDHFRYRGLIMRYRMIIFKSYVYRRLYQTCILYNIEIFLYILKKRILNKVNYSGMQRVYNYFSKIHYCLLPYNVMPTFPLLLKVWKHHKLVL